MANTTCPRCGFVISETVHTGAHMAPIVNVKNPNPEKEAKPAKHEKIETKKADTAKK